MKFKSMKEVSTYMSLTKDYSKIAKDILFLSDLKDHGIEYFFTKGMLIQINEFKQEDSHKGSCLD